MSKLLSFVYRLSRCIAITTGEDGQIPSCKPFKYRYEKEIVIYPCLNIQYLLLFVIHLSFQVTLLQVLNNKFSYFMFLYGCWCRPRAILDIIKSGEDFRISTTTKMPKQGTCERCGCISSQVCSFHCSILHELI